MNGCLLHARELVPAALRLVGLAALLWTVANIGQCQEPAAEPVPAAQPAAEAKPPERKKVGRLISIPAPLTSNIVNRVSRTATRVIDEASKRNEHPVLIFEIGKGSNKLGITRDLADVISKLSGATTVAWLPQGCRGHSLLLAMACEQIAMPGDVEIGEANADEPMITDAIRGQYAEIAARRHSIPTALALGMLDPQLEVWQVETETSTEFVLTENLEDNLESMASTTTSKKNNLIAGN